MRPFNIELWKAGEPVITRDGREVEQLTYFENATEIEFKLMGVVAGEINSWKLNGRYAKFEKDNDFDLFHPEQERWANIYKREDHECLGMVCYSEEEAKLSANGRDNYIGTYKLVKP